MAKKKVKPPPGRRRSAARPGGNTGWWAGIAVVVLAGVALVVTSRGDRASAEIVRDLTAPSVANAGEVTLREVAVEPFDRVEEGETIAVFEAGGDEAALEAPVDGFVVSLGVAVGEATEPGAVVGTIQTGPDLDTTNAAGHHWHIAYGVYVCDTFLPPVGEFQGSLHTHGDGLIHAHPLSNAEAGSNATVARFFENAGLQVSGERLRYSDGETYRSGDVDCNGQDGVLQWSLNGEVQEGDPGELIVGNGDVLVIAFVPEGEEFPTVAPSAPAMEESYNVTPKHPDLRPATDETGETGESADDAGDGDAGADEGSDGGEPTSTTAAGGDAGGTAPPEGEGASQP